MNKRAMFGAIVVMLFLGLALQGQHESLALGSEISFLHWYPTPSGNIVLCEDFGPTSSEGPEMHSKATLLTCDKNEEMPLFDDPGLYVFPSSNQPAIIGAARRLIGAVRYQSVGGRRAEGEPAQAWIGYRFVFDVFDVSNNRASKCFRTELGFGDSTEWWPAYPVRYMPRFKTWVCLGRHRDVGEKAETVGASDTRQRKALFISDAGEIISETAVELPDQAVFWGSVVNEAGDRLALVFVDRGDPWAYRPNATGRIYTCILDMRAPESVPRVSLLCETRGSDASTCCVSRSGKYLCTLKGDAGSHQLLASIWALRGQSMVPLVRSVPLPEEGWSLETKDQRWIVKWALDSDNLVFTRSDEGETRFIVTDPHLHIERTRRLRQPLPGYTHVISMGDISYFAETDVAIYNSGRQSQVVRYDFRSGKAEVIKDITAKR
ncbi:MAG TPA: hypothetical protein VM163_01800 [bacterium]|nr:hypothetical protein [bacterium]